jgi:hypothetical protein
MKSKHKNNKAKLGYKIGAVSYRPIFPRPICLEKCTMNMPNGYEKDILMTLRAFSSQESYNRKTPHKLQGRETWSLDVKARTDKYRLLFYVDNGICKIIDPCTEETH